RNIWRDLSWRLSRGSIFARGAAVIAVPGRRRIIRECCWASWFTAMRRACFRAASWSVRLMTRLRSGSLRPTIIPTTTRLRPSGGEAAVGKLSDENADVQAGINIVLRALEAPIRQIVENAGVEGSIVVGKITENKSQTYGFDAQTEQYVDILEAGIVDPAKVVRVALQDAASVAGLMITTEAMVAEAPKKKEAPAMPGGGMGGMDY